MNLPKAKTTKNYVKPQIKGKGMFWGQFCVSPFYVSVSRPSFYARSRPLAIALLATQIFPPADCTADCTGYYVASYTHPYT